MNTEDYVFLGLCLYLIAFVVFCTQCCGRERKQKPIKYKTWKKQIHKGEKISLFPKGNGQPYHNQPKSGGDQKAREYLDMKREKQIEAMDRMMAIEAKYEGPPLKCNLIEEMIDDVQLTRNEFDLKEIKERKTDE